MNDRSLEYRALAAECLKLAGSAVDPTRRSEYLALAQMWKELAKEAAAGARMLDRVQEEFNTARSPRASNRPDRSSSNSKSSPRSARRRLRG